VKAALISAPTVIHRSLDFHLPTDEPTADAEAERQIRDVFLKCKRAGDAYSGLFKGSNNRKVVLT
jgi:hypothetical protein